MNKVVFIQATDVQANFLARTHCLDVTVGAEVDIDTNDIASIPFGENREIYCHVIKIVPIDETTKCLYLRAGAVALSKHNDESS